MNFAHPLWLVAGVLACSLLVWQYRRHDGAQRAALARFAAARLLPGLTTTVSAARRRAKRTLFVAGAALLFVALARPQVGYVWQEAHRKGLELLFAIDTSKSMLAQDVKPDRLGRAKLAVTDLVARLDGDGVGLIAFSGSAFLQCPVTLDYDAFRESLAALDVGVIPRGGTDIAAAIREAEAVFETRTTAEKILVLITDGEDLGGEGIATARAAAENGIKIFTVGVGGTTGELVPVPDERGGTDFARDASGQLVRSQLDETTLREIAAAAGGIYQPLGIQGEGLALIYDDGLAPFTREDLSARQNKVPLEQFPWALAAALACFLAEHLLGNRRRTRRPATSLAAPATAALALAFLGLAPSARAAVPQSAEEAYHQGDYTRSQQEYAAAATAEPENAQLRFNTGSAAYKAGDYAAAMDAFRQSIETGDVPVQQGAYYNLGNTQFRLGQATETADPEATIKTWEEAVESYDAALQITPDDTSARSNRELVQRKIDALRKQEEQKKEEQQDKQDQPKEQQDETQDSSGDSEDASEEQKDASDKSDPSDPSEESEEPGKADQQPEPDEQAPQGEPEQTDSAKPGDEPSTGNPEPANGEPTGDPGDATATGERREPGQMTADEAQQLLDALKGDERQLPATSVQGRAAGQPRQPETLKDW